MVFKDITLTTQRFLFVLFLLRPLQQFFFKIPANQIVISTYKLLLYKLNLN